MVLAAGSELRLDVNAVDYALIAIYFVFVLGIGILARRSVSSSIDFFLSMRLEEGRAGPRRGGNRTSSASPIDV